MHLCGFAFYCNNRKRQVGLHHYGNFLNEDFGQFIVYDSPGPDARMIGIEYVVTERLFATFSEEEQKYWHSHSYDVESGSFFAPGIPDMIEKGIMQEVAATYGKTFLLWQVDRGDPLPFGPPQLMMVANGNGQWSDTLYEQRAQEMKCKKSDFLERRKGMTFPPRHPGSDAWSRGEAIDLHVVPLEEKTKDPSAT